MEDAFLTTVFPNVSAIQVSKGLVVKLKKEVSSLENHKQCSSIFSISIYKIWIFRIFDSQIIPEFYTRVLEA